MLNILEPLIKRFLPFAQERMGFEDPPKLFLKNDDKNANDPLGKTAYYDPASKSVTLYTTGRHPKDVMRSLSHELVHHTQNCRGEFDNAGEMGEGYAQNDEHLREMEREAYEVGNMCFRDWEDSIKNTIYYEHLQKGENKMSTKDWKNKELTQLLSEAWGFKFNSLQEFDEFNGTGEVQEESDTETEIQEVSDQEGKKDAEMETKGDATDEEEKEDLDEGGAAKRAGNEDRDAGRDRMSADRVHEGKDQIFAPNHYCIHHGGVMHNGAVKMAEAVGHNWNEELGRVTAYDMKLEDGTILENVSAEDIQVTSASLALEHGDHPAKRDTTKKDDELKDTEDDGARGEKKGDKAFVNEEEEIEELARATSHDRRTPHKSAKYKDEGDEDKDELKEAIKTLLGKYIKG